MRDSSPSHASPAGLCDTCKHARMLAHPRGGAPYWRCGRSDHDPRYPKYPRLPVSQCLGYEPSPEDDAQP